MYTSEINLWVAVLGRAIDDLYYKEPKDFEALSLCNKSKVSQELYWKRQARAWFKNKNDEFNSFQGVCLILGLSATKIQGKLFQKGLL